MFQQFEDLVGCSRWRNTDTLGEDLLCGLSFKEQLLLGLYFEAGGFL